MSSCLLTKTGVNFSDVLGGSLETLDGDDEDSPTIGPGRTGACRYPLET